MKFVICWDMAPCSPYMSRRFGGTYHLHFQGRKSAEQKKNQREQEQVPSHLLSLVIRSSETSVYIDGVVSQNVANLIHYHVHKSLPSDHIGSQLSKPSHFVSLKMKSHAPISFA
jgi:hypothetical protein